MCWSTVGVSVWGLPSSFTLTWEFSYLDRRHLGGVLLLSLSQEAGASKRVSVAASPVLSQTILRTEGSGKQFCDFWASWLVTYIPAQPRLFLAFISFWLRTGSLNSGWFLTTLIGPRFFWRSVHFVIENHAYNSIVLPTSVPKYVCMCVCVLFLKQMKGIRVFGGGG